MSHYLNFFLAVTKYHDQKQLQGERIYFSLQFIVHHEVRSRAEIHTGNQESRN